MFRSIRSLFSAFHALVVVHLLREKSRSLLTLIGVALGVAVVVAINLANEATVSHFKATVEQVAGKAQLQVRRNGGDIRDAFLGKVYQAEAVAMAAPRLDLYTGVTEATGEVLVVYGLDFINDTYFRTYDAQKGHGDDPNESAFFTSDDDAAQNPDELDDTLNPFKNPAVIFVTKVFADKHGKEKGDPIALTFQGRDVQLIIAGLIEKDAHGGLIDQNTAVMDLYGAQTMFGKSGWLTAIDLIVDPRYTPESAAEQLRKILPEHILVERPEQRGETVDKMLAAFQYNLRALATIALLVGVFLIYNTVSISVVRRREEIGTLRALGAKSRLMLFVFLCEGLFFGLIGALLGVTGGYYLAQGLLIAMNQALAYHWLSSTASQAAFSLPIAGLAAGLGIVLSLIAAYVPAREAANIPPANTMRSGSFETSRRGRLVPFVIAGVLLLGLSLMLARQPSIGGIPVFGFASAFFLMIGCAFLAPLFVIVGCKALKLVFGVLFGAEGALAVKGVEGARSRATVAVCGLMVSLAMVIGLGIMVGSFRKTVSTWLNQTLQADLYLQPIGITGQPSLTATFPAELSDKLAKLDGVAAADGFRSFRILFNGFPASLATGDFEMQIKRGHAPIQGQNVDATLEKAMQPGHVLVSETLAYRHGLESGDVITIPYESGVGEVTIAGIYADYSSDLGFILMHRDNFNRHYSDRRNNSISIYVEEGVDPDELREQVIAAFGADYPMRIDTNRAIRVEALKIFDQTFSITYVLMIIAMVIAMLGITTTLLSTILDRRRELVTLRFLGMSRGSVGRVILYESAILGITGTALGVLCGLFLSLLLIFVINKQSFGWTIEFSPPWIQLVVLTGILYLCTLLSGLLPAREAGRVDLRYR
jgi:putative ABC transport system permease protein